MALMNLGKFFARRRKPVLPLLLIALLTDCGGGQSGSSSSPASTLPPPPVGPINTTLSGTVMNGASPISNAAVTVYEADGNGISVIGSGSSDNTGHYSFGIANPNNAEIIFALATGGDAGHGANNAIRLMTILGSGVNLSSSTHIVINELTTTAAVWASAQLLQPDGTLNGPLPSLQIAADSAASLVDAGTGSTSTLLASGANTPDKFNSIANMLAACVASTGPATTPCAQLFVTTTFAGEAAPSNTLAAALAVARHPADNVAALFTLASAGTTFAPSLAAAPTDWTLSLNFTGGGLSEPTQLAIDAQGRAWVADHNGAVSAFSSAGLPLSPPGGYTGGGLRESFGIAIDPSGKVWVCNEESPVSFNSGHGSVTVLGADGAVLSGSNGYAGGGLNFPMAVAADATGNIWLANYGNSSITAFNAFGTPLSPATGYTGGGLSFPLALAFDATGRVWVADNGANQITTLSSLGVPLSPASGYTGGGLDGPEAIALDQQGNAWVANFYGERLPVGARISAISPTGVALSPDAGYTGGGLHSPGGIAVDGKGNIWITNYNGASITTLSGMGGAVPPGTPLSPSGGFTANGILQPYNPAIDSAGNLWTANYGNDSITKFIGIAAPVATPLLGLPRAP